MKTVFINLFMLFVLCACSSDDSSAPRIAVSSQRLSIDGAPGDLGVFDPSVARDPDTGRLWMSYSAVNSSIYYPKNLYWTVSIRLAYSDDNGVRWQDAGAAASPALEAVLGPMTPDADIPADSAGIWQSETSVLVYDPAAVAGERWKLFWHQYLNANLVPYFVDHAWIALKMAATPQELVSASPIKLFAGFGLQTDGSNTGAPVFSPTGGSPAIQLNTDITRVLGGADLAELTSCVFAEPGLFATDAALYLPVYCVDVAALPISEYLVYFRCNSPCNMVEATSWEYLGRLLTPADAQATTVDHHYQAPSIVQNKGRSFLLVTPVDTTSGDRYDGCRMYEFSDINSNQLRRNNSGLLEIARLDGDVGSHNGACAAYSGQGSSIFLSQFEPASTAETFNIYQRKLNLP